MEYAAAIAAVAAVVGQLIAAGQEAEARKEIEKARARFGAIAMPDLERAVAEHLNSETGRLKSDPQLGGMQMSALDALRQIGNEGFDAADQAALARIGNANARHEAAGRAAIAENMAARGIGGGGAELAMKLSGNQAAAARASQQGLELAGMAQRRRLEALERMGGLAGKLRGQDWDERSEAAKARDYMNQWNANSRERTRQYNNQMAQQQYGNQMNQAQAMAGQDRVMHDDGYRDAQNTRNFWTSMGQATGYGTADYLDDDEDKR
jgi:hypothetical protein